MSDDRRPRASFTKKLERICRALDEAPKRWINHKDHYGGPQTSQVEITEVWVVGSYGRGALECGDLDLVFSHRVSEGPWVDRTPITKLFFGSMQLVRYYVGSPESNTSGVSFSDAIQIWSGAGCEWRARIDAIVPDPNVGRATRLTDSIPLRNEQLRLYGNEMVVVADLERKGILEWDFAEIDHQMLAPFAATGLDLNARRMVRHSSILGKKTQRLMPALFRLMRRYEPNGAWSSDTLSTTVFRCGGSSIYIGRPPLPIERFDADPSLRQLVLVPHLTARGPNGVWLIRRGPNHPDVMALTLKHAFYLASKGAPDFLYHQDGLMALRCLQLFGTAQAAQEHAAIWAQGDDTDYQIAEVTGAEVLGLLSIADTVEISGAEFHLTPQAAFCFKSARASLGDLIAALPASL